MTNPVEATATTAGQLFSANRFHVPDFQREYSWRVEEEVDDYWRDVTGTIDADAPHFLGLIIMTEEHNRMTIVDGQQRILTTFLLAHALREEAIALERRLVANSLTDKFLYELDFTTEARRPRIHLSSERDRTDLNLILNGADVLSNSRLAQAWRHLRASLRADLKASQPPLRLGQWAQHLNSGLQFAVFEHPDRNAAFKVYEVINTRGKQLTAAELLKSYIIGTAGDAKRTVIVDRWHALEAALDPVEITRFIRHAATLRHGYVIQRDLYQTLTKEYRTPEAVEEFTDYLTPLLPFYQQFVDPTGDFVTDDDFSRAARVLDSVGLATVRPLFLAIAQTKDARNGFAQALTVVLPRIVVESFGTGAIEARFAKAAQDIHSTGHWEGPLAELATLKPGVTAFMEAIQGGRSLTRSQMHAVRAGALQGTVLPLLEGSLHFIRTRYGQGWTYFDDDDFREYGNRVGNTVILKTGRRPHGSSSSAGALTRLLPEIAPGELVDEERLRRWSPKNVVAVEREIASRARSVWYPEAAL